MSDSAVSPGLTIVELREIPSPFIQLILDAVSREKPAIKGLKTPGQIMRQPSFGSQSNFRFNLRTDHQIIDIARHYHELQPLLLWVDHDPNSDSKVAPICIFPFDTASNLLQSIEMAAAAKGVTVIRCSSSQEALSFLDSGFLSEYRALPPSKFRIMSNRQRPEGQHIQLNPNAGINFAELSRHHG